MSVDCNYQEIKNWNMSTLILNVIPLQVTVQWLQTMPWEIDKLGEKPGLPLI